MLFPEPRLFDHDDFERIPDETPFQLLITIRVENMRGLLYWPDGSEPIELDVMVEAGLVVEVPATPTSLRGYVATPRSVDDHWPVPSNSPGGEA